MAKSLSENKKSFRTYPVQFMELIQSLHRPFILTQLIGIGFVTILNTATLFIPYLTLLTPQYAYLVGLALTSIFAVCAIFNEFVDNDVITDPKQRAMNVGKDEKLKMWFSKNTWAYVLIAVSLTLLGACSNYLRFYAFMNNALFQIGVSSSAWFFLAPIITVAVASALASFTLHVISYLKFHRKVLTQDRTIDVIRLDIGHKTLAVDKMIDAIEGNVINLSVDEIHHDHALEIALKTYTEKDMISGELPENSVILANYAQLESINVSKNQRKRIENHLKFSQYVCQFLKEADNVDTPTTTAFTVLEGRYFSTKNSTSLPNNVPLSVSLYNCFHCKHTGLADVDKKKQIESAVEQFKVWLRQQDGDLAKFINAFKRKLESDSMDHRLDVSQVSELLFEEKPSTFWQSLTKLFRPQTSERHSNVRTKARNGCQFAAAKLLYDKSNRFKLTPNERLRNQKMLGIHHPARSRFTFNASVWIPRAFLLSSTVLMALNFFAVPLPFLIATPYFSLVHIHAFFGISAAVELSRQFHRLTDKKENKTFVDRFVYLFVPKKHYDFFMFVSMFLGGVLYFGGEFKNVFVLLSRVSTMGIIPLGAIAITSISVLNALFTYTSQLLYWGHNNQKYFATKDLPPGKWLARLQTGQYVRRTVWYTRQILLCVVDIISSLFFVSPVFGHFLGIAMLVGVLLNAWVVLYFQSSDVAETENGAALENGRLNRFLAKYIYGVQINPKQTSKSSAVTANAMKDSASKARTRSGAEPEDKQSKEEFGIQSTIKLSI